MPEQIVIIVAAGTGSRFGTEMPKQFLPLCGTPVVAHAINAFREALGADSRILLVLSEPMIPLWRRLCADYAISSPEIVTGGATRWESVRNAIAALGEASPSATVLIHDGARPLVTPEVIRRAASTTVR